MKKSKTLIKVSFVLISLLVVSTLYGEARVVAAISSMKGNVQIRSATERKYESAYKGQMIRTGDWIKTDLNVFVAIIFLDGSNIKIREKTEIEIMSSRVAAKKLMTLLYIAEGQVWSKVTKESNSGFHIKTPTALASVKGTEFNVDFNDLTESTTLTVIEGEVLFSNGLSAILASAMEGASITKDEAPKIYKVEPKDLPKWQNDIDPSWGFKLTPNKSGKHLVNQSVKVSIQAINTKTKELDNRYNNEVQVSTDSDLLYTSIDGTSWSNTVNMTLKNGRGTIQIKGGYEGTSSIIVSAQNAESKKLAFEFYISNSRKKTLDAKLLKIIDKKGFSAVSQFIEGKSLKSIAVTLGEANIDVILQKVDTGELEIVSAEQVENADGTFSIVLIVKPPTQGDNQ
jgi:hypothetical protein